MALPVRPSGRGTHRTLQTSAPPLPGSLAQLLNIDSLPLPKPWQVSQASGYDRDGGYYDSGNFLRTEPGRRHVLMEC